jgi:tRNA threonylcarbamoyladenosine biosynthesis protein TsaB
MMEAQGPLILALDTSTACCSLAITSGTTVQGKILASVSLNSKVRHSRRLLTAIDWMLSETDVDWSMVEAIAIGLGPGSFTGLRIGMATAKGLAATSGRPLIGIPTLDALASSCTTEKKICAVLDARKKQVYTAWYCPNPSGRADRIGSIRALDPALLTTDIQEPVLMVGDGVLTYGQLWRQALGDKVAFAPIDLLYPSAAVIGLLAGIELKEGRSLDLASAVPLYIRASDAELSIERKKQPKLGDRA